MVYRKWQCTLCGWVYDEDKGSPEESLAPGTRWEDVPDTWACPSCGAAKSEFQMEPIG